jgi:ring-1,2-phenylacetyl-CoA epoxidase subunit PaaD
VVSSAAAPSLSFPQKRESSGTVHNKEVPAPAHQFEQSQELDPRFRGDDSVGCSDDELNLRVLEILSHVPDPEIPCVSVVDLGIIREVRAGDPPYVVITPTYTGCPATLAIHAAIRAALDNAGLSEMRIETTLSPPWTTDWISDVGREKLRAYGIAPPAKGADRHSLRDERAECPRCGSQRTEEISRFGSTPCKSLHRCRDCSEPFDRFKCH